VNVHETGRINREQMARGTQACYHVKQWKTEVFYSATKPKSEAFFVSNDLSSFWKVENVFVVVG